MIPTGTETAADVLSSIVLLGVLLGVGALYAIRISMRGVAHHERVELAGRSPLLGRSSMEGAYWALDPVASACVALGISANTITTLSLLFGLFTGALLVLGHFGLAAVATTVSSLADALDGLVARKSGTASDIGEVFDAAADRYVELFFLGGLAVFFRDDVVVLVLVLAAILGSFMVSYSTAKAEALHLPVPRGAMRRAERAVVLFVGVLLTPFAALFAQSHQSPFGGYAHYVGVAPTLIAVTLVATVANISAVRRLLALATSIRESMLPRGDSSSRASARRTDTTPVRTSEIGVAQAGKAQ